MKSETRFTPPPWALLKNYSAKYDIVLDGDSKNSIALFVDEHDALLIKASPKLYHALENLLDAFDRLTTGFPLSYEENQIRKEMAQIALAEACGEDI